MSQLDIHYFDELHRVLLSRIQSGNAKFILTVLALPHVHNNALFWRTCTYPAGLVAAVLAASFETDADAWPSVSSQAPRAVDAKDTRSATDVPVTQSQLPLALHGHASDVDGTQSVPKLSDARDGSQLIGGTPAPVATPLHRVVSTSPDASPCPHTPATSSATTAALSLPELYQLLVFCLRASSTLSPPQRRTAEAEGGLALLQSLVHLLEQPATSPSGNAPGQAPHEGGALTDGETVDLVAVCATLLEQVRGLAYANPLEDEVGPVEARSPSSPSVIASGSTTTSSSAAAPGATTSLPSVAAHPTNAKRARSPEGSTTTTTTGAMAKKAKRDPPTTEADALLTSSHESLAGATTNRANSAAQGRAAPLASTAPVSVLAASHALDLDDATAPYTSTDAVEVLKGIAPLPGTTRLLPSFTDVGDFSAHDDTEHYESTLTAEAVAKREPTPPQKHDHPMRENSAHGRHEDVADALRSDADDEEDKTVLEVLQATADKADISTTAAAGPAPTVAKLEPTQGDLPHPPAAPSPPPPMAEPGPEEAARVAFAIEAFDRYEEEVAMAQVRHMRAAVLGTHAATPATASAPTPTVARVPVREGETTAPHGHVPEPRRRRIHFTEEEDAAIVKGVARFGQTTRSFLHIFQAYRGVWQEGRTATKLSDHWRDALKKKVLSMRVAPPATKR